MPKSLRAYVRVALVVAICSTVGSAAAQRRRPAPKPAPKPAPAKPAPEAAPAVAPAAAGPDELRTPDLLATKAGGLTSEQVGTRAMKTSYVAKAAAETAEAASARVDQALVGYVPRITLLASYTRLSPFTPPVVGGGAGNFVVTPTAPGTVNPTPVVAAAPLSFPLIFDLYNLQATAVVPISDYFLTISRSYTAATQQEEAARYDAIAAKAKSYSDGRIAYFTWLRSRGAVNVATQTLAVARAHLKDAESLFAAGSASKADVLRAQTAVAGGELVVERAKSAAFLGEQQLRVAMHASPDETFEPGEALDSADAASTVDVKGLVAEGHANRAELKSIERNAEALRKLAAASRASRYPSLSAFGEARYANPNPRRFPQQDEWFATWAVGAQLTWSPNEAFGAGAANRDLEARAAALDAQRAALRDGVELEVLQAHQALLEADVAMQTTARQLESATENYRVARELFNNARTTATALVDAETILAQTRFEHLNARTDARVARIRLEHAAGRDLRFATAPR